MPLGIVQNGRFLQEGRRGKGDVSKRRGGCVKAATAWLLFRGTGLARAASCSSSLFSVWGGESLVGVGQKVPGGLRKLAFPATAEAAVNRVLTQGAVSQASSAQVAPFRACGFSL